MNPNFATWTPMYTLADLVAMRTKPYLGFIPQRRDYILTDPATQQPFTIRDVQLDVPHLGVSEIIEIGKSLIFHSDAPDMLSACLTHIDAELEHNSIARLLLTIDLYSQTTALAVCSRAIVCAYDSDHYYMAYGRFRRGQPVWKWRNTEQSLKALYQEQEDIRAIVEDFARDDKHANTRAISRQYSNETLNLFLKQYNIHNCPLTVTDYCDCMKSNMPISIQAFLRKHTGCVECAIANAVGRKCTVKHTVQKKKSSNVEPSNTELPKVEPAYFAPPPSAPPMEEMHHI